MRCILLEGSIYTSFLSYKPEHSGIITVALEHLPGETPTDKVSSQVSASCCFGAFL